MHACARRNVRPCLLFWPHSHSHTTPALHQQHQHPARACRPQELDDAVRRRLVKRIFIPLPDADGRAAILSHLLGPAGGSSSSVGGGASRRGSGSASGGVRHVLSQRDVARIVAATDGYSASDLTALCREAALGPVRDLGPAIADVSVERIRPVALRDFEAALTIIRPSLGREQLRVYEQFTREYGAA